MNKNSDICNAFGIPLPFDVQIHLFINLCRIIIIVHFFINVIIDQARRYI